MMPVNENIPLEEQLRLLGFKNSIKDVKKYARMGSHEFMIPQSRVIKNDSLLYRLEFENRGNETKLKKYGLTLQSVKIPKAVINGINTAKLEKRLIQADKFYNDYYSKDKPATKEETKIIESVNKDIHQLFEAGGYAKEIASLMKFKYWPEENFKQYMPELAKLKENYQAEIKIEWSNGNILTADEAYNKAKEIFYTPKAKEMTEEHVISDGLFEQAQFELSFNRNWIAYNTIYYFLNKGDVNFFKNKDEAMEFSANNISEYDNYKVIHADSIRDFLMQFPYESRLEKELQINPDVNGLHNKEGNAFTDALIDHFEAQQSLFNSQLKTNVMNNENLQYLTDNIKYMGFGETLKAELEKNMGEGKGEFQLHFKAEINKKPFEAKLNFRKSDSSDMYFFNNYHASLEKSNGEKNEQTFYLNKGKGITAKEAYNLLDGRAVHKDLVTKEGQPYKAWIQLDFENKDSKNNFEVKQFHENYGYDLKASVEKFAVAEMKDPEKEKALMQSLQKGNVQSVTIEKDGSSHKMFMEADPQFKKVTLYDSNMKMVAKESLEKYKSGIEKGGKAMEKELGPDKKKDLKQEVKPEKEKLEKKNGQSLLPKKRESRGKGLGVS
jgi:hypothetical protein